MGNTVYTIKCLVQSNNIGLILDQYRFSIDYMHLQPCIQRKENHNLEGFGHWIKVPLNVFSNPSFIIIISPAVPGLLVLHLDENKSFPLQSVFYFLSYPFYSLFIANIHTGATREQLCLDF